MAARGTDPIRDGAVITVDMQGVLPRADVLVRDGRIEAVGPGLAPGRGKIDATDMIVMPGFVEPTTTCGARSAATSSATASAISPAKNATSKLFGPGRLLQQRDVLPGETRQRRRHHRPQLVAQHAHRQRTPTPSCVPTGSRCCVRSIRYGHVDQMPRNEPLEFASIDRVQRRLLRQGRGLRGACDLWGVNLRGGLAERGSHLPPGDGIPRCGRGLMDRDPRRPVAAQPHILPTTTRNAAGSARNSWISNYLPASDADVAGDGAHRRRR